MCCLLSLSLCHPLMIQCQSSLCHTAFHCVPVVCVVLFVLLAFLLYSSLWFPSVCHSFILWLLEGEADCCPWEGNAVLQHSGKCNFMAGRRKEGQEEGEAGFRPKPWMILGGWWFRCVVGGWRRTLPPQHCRLPTSLYSSTAVGAFLPFPLSKSIHSICYTSTQWCLWERRPTGPFIF